MALFEPVVAIEVCTDLVDWLETRLTRQSMGCSSETYSYVLSVLGRRRWNVKDDMSHESIVMSYVAAMEARDFEIFQRIGDWVMFVSSVHPQYIAEHRDVTESLGRMSYFACYKMLNKKWRLYEELADALPTITSQIHHVLAKCGAHPHLIKS